MAPYPSFFVSDNAAEATRAAAFAAQSPRCVVRRTPLLAWLIYGGVFSFWIALTIAAFVAEGIFAWSIGIAYIAYDTVLIVFVASRIAAIRRPLSADTGTQMQRPSLAVIVAAWNEAQTLPRTIDALLGQDDVPELVVIADDGSDDATPEVLRARFDLTSSPTEATPSFHTIGATTIVWLRLPHRGKAQALNAALVRVATDIVVTVDADTILARDAIAATRDAFARDPKLAVGGGILIPACPPTRTGRALQYFQRYEYIRNFMSRYAWSQLDALLLISGAFAGFRREALMATGGFDRDSFVEDYELIHRIQRFSRDGALGWRVRILGTARATTGAPATPGTFLRQRRRWFAGFLQTQYWHRDMTGTRRFGALGFAMLPVKAVDTLQPVYGLTALALLPVFLLTGRAALVAPVFGIMTAKIAIDLAFYVACIALYRRWTGDRTTSAGLPAIAAAVVEPFTFQPLRHLGAAWGWIALLTGDRRWGSARAKSEASPTGQ